MGFEPVKEAKCFEGSKSPLGGELFGVSRGVSCGVPCGVLCSLCGSGVRGESSSGSRGALEVEFCGVSSQNPVTS